MFRGIQILSFSREPASVWAYIDTDVNCLKKLSISVVGVRKKLRRLSTVGYHGYTLSTRRRLRQCSQPGVSGRIWRFPQDLEETEYFSRWRQEEVAKIVQ